MWDTLLEESLEYLRAQQDRLRRDFGLSSWERFDYDQETGTINFSTNGQVGLVADFVAVGSTANTTGTWLWSWENPSILSNVSNPILAVREHGRKHGFRQLVEAKWRGDERDGWEMTAISAFLLQAEGAYRAPDARGALFMILTNVRRLESVAE